MTLAEELRALAERIDGDRYSDAVLGANAIEYIADLLALAARTEREQAFLAAVEDAVSKMQPGGPGTTIFLQGLVGLPDAYRAMLATEARK